MDAREGMAGGAGGGGRRTPTPDGEATAYLPGVAGTDDAGMCCALASGASAAQHTRQRTQPDRRRAGTRTPGRIYSERSERSQAPRDARHGGENSPPHGNARSEAERREQTSRQRTHGAHLQRAERAQPSAPQGHEENSSYALAPLLPFKYIMSATLAVLCHHVAPNLLRCSSTSWSNATAV